MTRQYSVTEAFSHILDRDSGDKEQGQEPDMKDGEDEKESVAEDNAKRPSVMIKRGLLRCYLFLNE